MNGSWEWPKSANLRCFGLGPSYLAGVVVVLIMWDELFLGETSDTLRG